MVKTNSHKAQMSNLRSFAVSESLLKPNEKNGAESNFKMLKNR